MFIYQLDQLVSILHLTQLNYQLRRSRRTKYICKIYAYDTQINQATQYLIYEINSNLDLFNSVRFTTSPSQPGA